MRSIAWAESNATVFANSVLGARTNRYGDFIHICAAFTGRVPDSGLHRTNNRRGQVLFRLNRIADPASRGGRLLPSPRPPRRGTGGQLGSRDERACRPGPEDQLKALGAAAASSGSVALFHVVGVTPEAATLEDALQGGKPSAVVDVTPAMVREARNALTTSERGPLVAVSSGTPHFSLAEFAALEQLRGLSIDPGVKLRLDEPQRPLRVRAAGLGVPTGDRRDSTRCGHVHLHHADPPPTSGPRYDELGEVGLLRRRQSGR